ncbi:hypothetical protein BT67DRAFT_211905 [Trichocladium antarcticum]|uniref:Uncharacterized protein n=1 Tax=Trichocladium antarcticum TaxID=1450529 RepID=A0AAN6ZAV4_9PEZI|nr:hypothetical protein BT67DRAFT_211905 [Trichocladium antarcticum]
MEGALSRSPISLSPHRRLSPCPGPSRPWENARSALWGGCDILYPAGWLSPTDHPPLRQSAVTTATVVTFTISNRAPRPTFSGTTRVNHNLIRIACTIHLVVIEGDGVSTSTRQIPWI